MAPFHFRPRDRWIGDLIPFFWDGEYHLFYLPRAPEGRHCWGHIVSQNLLDWEELPDVIAPSDDADAVGCWTGSVIEHNGIFHCFYTGFNPKSRYSQTICHAFSHDLIHWRKDGANPILVPDERWYEPNDWRDPFVFFNPEAGEFWMLICARDKRVAFERRGCIALATSKDLHNWQVHEPIWSGCICWAAECPEMFKIGDRWYLVYSHGTTRYRWLEQACSEAQSEAECRQEGSAEQVAQGGSGRHSADASWLTTNGGCHSADASWRAMGCLVWLASFPDTFDTEFVAAAKSLFDGKRRILFGWIGTLEGDSDFGARQWGGHMALPRELVMQADGSLAVKLPEEFESWQSKNAVQLQFQDCEPLCGSWELGEDVAAADSPNGVSVLRCNVPVNFFLSSTVIPLSDAVEFGFLLRMSNGKGHKIAIDKNRLALMRWSSWGDIEPKLSRPISWREGEPLKVHLIVHGSIVEIFVGDRVSLAGRIYEPSQGWLGIFVANGFARIRDVKVAGLPALY